MPNNLGSEWHDGKRYTHWQEGYGDSYRERWELDSQVCRCGHVETRHMADMGPCYDCGCQLYR